MTTTNSIESVFQKLEARAAFSLLEKHKGLIDAGIIEFEQQLAEAGISHPVRAATLAFYLIEVMFRLTTSIACCEENYKSKLERLAETLRADALRRANDVEQYRVVMRAMGREPKAACGDAKPAKPPLLN